MKNIHFTIAKRTSHHMRFFEVHQEIEMYYLREGSRIYFVEDRTYPLTAGSVLWIGSNRIHKTSSNGQQPHERLLLQVHPDFLETCVPFFPDVSLDFLLSKTAVLSTPDSPYNAVIRQSFEEIERLNRERPIGYESEIKLNVGKLVLSFLRTLCDSDEGNILNSPKHQKIYEILRYIGSNMEHITSLDMLCQHFYISKYYLCHSFKEVTGLSVMAFMNMTRVLRASVLLQQDTMSVAQVGKAVGFKNLAQFTSVFKRLVGLTPNEYRKRYQAGKAADNNNRDDAD